MLASLSTQRVARDHAVRATCLGYFVSAVDEVVHNLVHGRSSVRSGEFGHEVASPRLRHALHCYLARSSVALLGLVSAVQVGQLVHEAQQPHDKDRSSVEPESFDQEGPHSAAAAACSKRPQRHGNLPRD